MSSRAILQARGAALCTVYVSVGREESVVAFLQAAALSASLREKVLLLSTFSDRSYNRTSWSFGGALGAITDAAATLVASALIEPGAAALVATEPEHPHPALGPVDHISLHPLLSTSLEDVGVAARNLGCQLAAAHSLPIYFYGSAHVTGRSLAEIRRSSDYFGGRGGMPRLPPDVGPSTSLGAAGEGQSLHLRAGAEVSPAAARAPGDGGVTGVCCVGAVPHVLNYNVRLSGAPSEELERTARRIARAVSARGGGLPGVEALALRYSATACGHEWEVACNLKDVSAAPPALVLSRIRELLRLGNDGAAESGAELTAVSAAYSIGVTAEDATAALLRSFDVRA